LEEGLAQLHGPAQRIDKDLGGAQREKNKRAQGQFTGEPEPRS
jgi:hypothetical protein